jgi:hypothetical protein
MGRRIVAWHPPSFWFAGLKPVFVDVDPATFNVRAADLEYPAGKFRDSLGIRAGAASLRRSCFESASVRPRIHSIDESDVLTV